MAWFPSDRSKGDGWKFDIVSLVAVIGESTVERHTQLITTSLFGWIPRLIPAPQVLLKTKRPDRLPPVKDVEIHGVFSGTKVMELNFFADVIHRIREMRPYEFRTYTIEKVPEKGVTAGKLRVVDDDKPGGGQQDANRAEKGQMNDQSRRLRYIEDNDIIIDTPFQLWNKLTLVTIMSMLMTIGLFIWAALIHDGVAMTAIGTISMSTSIACLANKWRPTLSSRAVINSVPKGDIVIKTRSGAFVVVHCNEDVTRELYTCTDVCRYKFEDSELQWMLGLSTVLLIASIIFFTNCGWAMQTAIGMTYIILNMMYWFIPFAMEDGKTWDLSLYRTIHDETKDRKKCSNYTETLWFAIRETKSVDWVKRSGAAPDTGAWREWLGLAQENVDAQNYCWNAVEKKDQLMAEASQLPTTARISGCLSA